MEGERETGAPRRRDSDAEPAEPTTTGEAATPPPPPSRPGAPRPAAREVERRSGTDRRVSDESVEEERRVTARRTADREARERRLAMVDRVTLGVDYLFYLLYGLLGVRFLLALLGAAETAGFVQFIHGITAPFYAPFSGIVASPSINGGVLDFALLIAVLAYVLLHIAVRGLLRLVAGDRQVA